MNENMIRKAALFMLVFMIAGIPFSFGEAYAAAGEKAVDDTYEIDFDPEDPALDDDEFDRQEALGEYADPTRDTAEQYRLSGQLHLDDGDADDPQNPVYDWFGVQGNNTAKITFLRNKKKKRYEYRRKAGQKMYGYDTFQGACSHGKYSWHVLFNRKNNKCRIIKVNMLTHKVVKKSKVLPLDHGNDMTYDTKRNQIVVVHYEPHPRRLSVIDPNKLTVIKVKNIKTPTERVSGASTKFSKSIKGVTGIGYDEDNDEYIVSIMGTRHYMALDASNFKILRVIKVPEIKPYVRQGMTVKDGFIIRAHSAYNRKYNQNILYVYDFAGNFVKTAKLGTGYEIESVFFRGKKMYASTYRSYLKKKYKKVRVKGKKRKKAYYVLRRDNNIIKITNY